MEPPYCISTVLNLILRAIPKTAFFTQNTIKKSSFTLTDSAKGFRRKCLKQFRLSGFRTAPQPANGHERIATRSPAAGALRITAVSDIRPPYSDKCICVPYAYNAVRLNVIAAHLHFRIYVIFSRKMRPQSIRDSKKDCGTD